jgi:hypothetical protein
MELWQYNELKEKLDYIKSDVHYSGLFIFVFTIIILYVVLIGTCQIQDKIEKVETKLETVCTQK